MNYQLRYRKNGKTILHGKKYGSVAEAEAMAIGLSLPGWEIIKVVKRAGTSMIWVTRDGRRMKVSEMEDAHLLNTLNMLYRRYQAKVISLYHSGYYRTASTVKSNGPAKLFEDKGDLAGWPGILEEYKTRVMQIPIEWQ